MSDATPETIAFFDNQRLTVEEIKAAGWRGWVGTGGWYGYEHETTGERYPVPHWIKQLIDRAEKQAEKNTKVEIRRALGLKVKEE